jgi:CMP-N,N'-diacetyllegionaminic acid synthase
MKYGAKVPYLRSAENATDKASSWDVVREALNRYEEEGRYFDMFTLLQPTTPLREAEDIQKAYNLYLEKQANAIVSVCEMDHSPLWSNTIPENLSMEHFIRREISERPRQELETYYRINGGIYMVRINYFKRTNDIYKSSCYAYIMNKNRSVDIDDELDFKVVESILRIRDEDINEVN